MKQPTTGASLPALFSLTLFLSAGLVFLVQPMFGKMVLPRFGGAPAVWNTCQVFFQAALLAGYLYAHFVSMRLGIRWQVALHGLILLLPLASLPIAAAAGWEPPGDANPAPTLLGLLAVSVGLPFVVVSTTAPLLQSWFTRSGDASAADPYFLYAASNAGSLLALLAYPLVIEPTLPLSVHSWIWAAGYVLLIGLVLACGIRVWRAADSTHTLAPSHPHTPAPVAAPNVTLLRRLHWLALAFVPSSLLLSVTLHITTDIAAVPLLWVLPLAIYLATFILAFARRQLIGAWLAARIMPLFVLALVIVLVSEATEPAWLLMLVHLAAFFIVALVCHGELARLRPAAEHLTEFYLWLSLGGILGGLFSALVAPLIFSTVVEYPLVVVLACLLRPPPPAAAPAETQDRQARRKKKAAIADAPKSESGAKATGWRLPPWLLDILLPIALGLATIVLIWISKPISQWLELTTVEGLAIAFALPSVACYLFLYRPARFALGIAAMLLASQLRPSIQGQILHVERSFFGVHRVAVDPSGKFLQLIHGSTVHGKQRLAEAPASGSPPAAATPAEPLNYYHRRGPAGDLFALPQVKEDRLPVAVVGLGTGSLAAYVEPGQALDYYEIDPVVKRIAEDGRYFTFLRECRGDYRILLGDARLKIGTAEEGRYGLIVVDAFSSDAVPLHLITREAIDMYVRKLADRGCLAFHVSNRYLDLSPVLANLARDRQLACLVRADIFGDHVEGQDPSIWVVLARRAADLSALPRPQAGVSPGRTWTEVTPASGAVWTDERANLFSAWNFTTPGP
jgi:hypothetical protein